MTEEAGTHKWVNVDDLTPGGKVLTHFEPGEIVRVKGRKFEVQRVQLEPPELRLNGNNREGIRRMTELEQICNPEPVQSEKERAAFETWVKHELLDGGLINLEREEGGEYSHSAANLAWEVWQAAIAKD